MFRKKTLDTFVLSTFFFFFCISERKGLRLITSVDWEWEEGETTKERIKRGR